MKTRILLLAAALLAAPLFAENAPKPAPDAAPDYSKFKTPDDFWAYLQNLQQTQLPQATSREEMIGGIKRLLTKQKEGAKAFTKAFPKDPRHWEAEVTALGADVQLKTLQNPTADTNAERKALSEVAGNKQASTEARSEALYLIARVEMAALSPDNLDTVMPLQKTIMAYLDEFPKGDKAVELAQVELEVLDATAIPDKESVLAKLANHPNSQVADLAKETQERAKRLAELKSKPVELKFTSTAGNEIDVAQLRGKVVLIDFWASWCGPCMAEMPNVVKTYKELHPQGFEIVGISLDQDKAAMEAALKKNGAEWPQYFDGAGWQNKISSSFGIQSIPAAWLLDKKGMLRETELRGEALAAAVSKLLKE